MRSTDSLRGGTQASPRHGAVQAPALSLPKGGGAIRGIDAKFSVNAATGTASLRVPIPATPGRAGFGPQLALAYDSGAGNGPFGWGWRLDVPTITRSTDKRLPTYQDADDSDIFVLSGAEELVPMLQAQGGRLSLTRRVDGTDYRLDRYRPRVEGPFARIERWTRLADGDVHWRSITRENVTTWYGRDAGSRVADPADPRRVFSWLICETRDDAGNAVVYEYDAEDSARVDVSLPQEANRTDAGRTAARYLRRVRYGNTVSHLVQPDLAGTQWLFELLLDYLEEAAGDERRSQYTTTAAPDAAQRVLVEASFIEPRPWGVRADPYSSFKSGFDVRTYRLCSRILVVHHFPDELGADDCLVRALRLEYEQSEVATHLTRITQSGYVLQEDGRYLERSLPPVELGYSSVAVDDTVRRADADTVAGLPAGIDEQRYTWLDLDGDGLPGVLTEQGEAWLYKRNFSPVDGGSELQLGPPEAVATRPSLPLTGAQLVDLTGSGTLDLVALRGSESGFHARQADEAQAWSPFQPFSSAPAFEASDPNLRFVDLNGDGRSDALVTEQDRMTWYRSLGEEGFGEAQHVPASIDEERGPLLVFADGTESIHLADMSGDGLTDLVRIRNGEICYWPNIGGGRFGVKVAMAGAPLFDLPDQFRPSCLRLADADGSGTTDVVYLGERGARLYFNQAGNSWSEGVDLRFAPPDGAVSVAALDLLGRGTACLVWSSPLAADAGAPLRYVDLMGGAKPHLLVSVVNNIGAETSVTYAPSTRFYLEDMRAGHPWRTRLPFPVHVVEQVETFDHVSGTRFVTRSAYHHGHYDGVEREFRGFGLVERWDTEELGALAAGDVPPVLTRTWFHTGAVAAGRPLRLYADEYYREPGLTDAQAEAQLPPDAALPDGLDGAETREALRALKGSLLREETYALDGSAKQQHPYRVVDRSHRVRRLQARDGNEHAVFLVHADESLEHFYERNPDDPRVAHSLVLEVDEYGEEVKTASVAYGRRKPDAGLSVDDQAEQARTWIRYLEQERTNAVEEPDAYRTPVAGASRRFHLTGYAPTGPAGRFAAADFVASDQGDPSGLRRIALFDEQIPYEQEPTGGRQRRLVSHELTLYRSDDLTGPLAPGVLESRALPFESYLLAFTPGLIDSGFGGQVTGALLEECRYVHPAGYAGWWAPSGRVFYSPPGVDGAADELEYAQRHFFRPLRFRDPFHSDVLSTERVVSYDPYDLLVEETVDPLGNRTTAGERALDPEQPLLRRGNDYRVLAASLVMDPNRNRSEVRFDALGLVAASAALGKPEDQPALGDRFDDSFAADPERADVDALLADPTGGTAALLLGGATTRFVYDLEATPACSVVLARETHVSSLADGEQTAIQVSFSYSDGLGREIQRKLPAEPGPAPQRNPDGSIVLGPDGAPIPAAGVADPRWIGSGWVVYNNKGQPVRELEPFFTDRHSFERDARVGVGTLHLYDAAGRCVARLHPDRTWEKIVFDAWRIETWDTNDTVLTDPATDADVGPYFAALPPDEYTPTWYAARQGGALGPDEAAAAAKAAVHAGTPSVRHANALAHPFLEVAQNRYAYSDAPPGDPPVEERHETRTVHDLDGQPLSVTDPLGRVMVRHEYDLLGDRFHVASMEGGEHWLLSDVSGAAAYSWDGRGSRIRTTFDQLRRPVESHLQQGATAEVLVGRSVYGEASAHPEATNVRGRLVRIDDQAGSETTVGYDFKGNPLGHARTLAQVYSETLDWNGDVALDGTVYARAGEYDALDRPVRLVMPDGSVFRPQYDRANQPRRLDVNLRGATENGTPVWTTFVASADYDAKGRPLLVEYGDGATSAKRVVTTYEYDRTSFRLSRLLTRRPPAAYPDDCPQPPLMGWPGCHVQDLTYTYDPVGNVTGIRDDAQQTIFFRNVRVEPSADFTYDARYRLIEARGREHVGQAGAGTPWSYGDAERIRLPAPGDGAAMARYVERYAYDFAGNVVSMRHRGSDPASAGWTRTYAYAESSALEPAKKSNRLTSSTVGATQETYSTGGDGYDASGNLLRMPQLQELQWDFRDHLRMTRRQAVDAGDADGAVHAGERTWYVYDADGSRVRKVTELASGQVADERVYVGGLEVYRRNAPNALVRETLPVMFGAQLIALVETRTDMAQPEQLVRYQFGNQLGSAVLELDAAGQVISYEEYSPYGSSSYQAVRSQVEAPKRYRFTGKERDEESGLYFHGARYYAPWLGRWTSADPAGAGNLYAYCVCNPLRLADPDGRDPQPPPHHQVGSYGKVGGDHVHQVASRTNAPGAKRTSASQYRQGLSVSTKHPAYNDKAGQRVERKVNRAQWGEDFKGRPADKGSYKGKVTLEATGDTTVGKTAAAQPSPWFEDLKSYFKLLEAGVPREEALQRVLQSGAQLEKAGAVPKRVPGAPRSVPRALQQGQQLTTQTPTELTPTVDAPSKGAAPASEPSRVGGGGAVGTVVNAAGVAALTGDTLVALHEGRTGDAVKTAAGGGAAYAVLTRVPALVPLAVMKSTIDSYDKNVERHAFAVGDFVADHNGGATLFPLVYAISPETANRWAGGVASAAAATGESLFQGTFGRTGRSIGQGAAVIYIRVTSDEYTLIPWRSQWWADHF